MFYHYTSASGLAGNLPADGIRLVSCRVPGSVYSKLGGKLVECRASSLFELDPGIRQSGQIKEGTGQYGCGVYVTDLAWGTDGRTLFKHLSINGSKVQRCIALHISGSELKSCRPHVWLYHGTVAIGRAADVRRSETASLLSEGRLTHTRFILIPNLPKRKLCGAVVWLCS